MKMFLSLLITLTLGLTNANAFENKIPQSVTYEVKKRIKNDKIKVLESYMNSSLIGTPIATSNLKSFTHVKECITNLDTKKQKHVLDTSDIGLKFIVEINAGKDTEHYNVTLKYDYSEILNMKKVKHEGCEIDLTNIRKWSDNSQKELKRNEEVVFATFDKYELTLKILP